MRIFGNGHFVHSRLQDCLGRAIEAIGGQFSAEVRLAKDDARKVSGTTDGVFVIDGWPYLLEIKSMNKRNFSELGAKPWDEHYDQLNIYMHLSGIKAAVILVECKDNQDLREYFVRYDPARWAKIEALTDRVLEFHNRGELPPKITVADGCSGRECKFNDICKAG